MKSIPAPLKKFIRAHHRLGWSDAEIAQAWNESHPDEVLNSRRLCEIRRKMQLPNNAHSPHRRAKIAAKTREQLAAAGLRSIGEIRAKAFVEFGARQGWPGIHRPRAVQILNLLYERGPHTRQQICAAIGMPWKGSRKSLCSNDPEGSYLAHLMARGLVVQLPGRQRTQNRGLRKGSGTSVYLYAIAPHVRRHFPSEEKQNHDPKK